MMATNPAGRSTIAVQPAGTSQRVGRELQDAVFVDDVRPGVLSTYSGAGAPSTSKAPSEGSGSRRSVPKLGRQCCVC
jgi:hypothetical protein